MDESARRLPASVANEKGSIIAVKSAMKTTTPYRAGTAL